MYKTLTGRLVVLINVSLILPVPKLAKFEIPARSSLVHENVVLLSALWGSYLNSEPEQTLTVCKLVKVGGDITVIEKLSETSDSPQEFIPLTFKNPEVADGEKSKYILDEDVVLILPLGKVQT